MISAGKLRAVRCATSRIPGADVNLGIKYRAVHCVESRTNQALKLIIMLSKWSLFALIPLISIAFASPTPVELKSRASIDTSSHCGQWDTVTAGQYSLLLDQWGASGATSGSQCANLVNLSGSTLSWKTTWTWIGGSGVKSFTNIQLNQGINQQLSAISSMPVRFSFAYSDTNTESLLF